MTKVSLILPSLNVNEYIRKCLDSVTKQTISDLEIICVDAGSTDGTLEVIEEFAQKDERIRIINSDRKSYGYQMNIGIDAAKGEYFGIVETDDYVLPEMYSNLYEIAKANDLDFIKSDFFRFVENKDGEEILYLNKLTNNENLYNRIINPSEEKDIFGCVMNTWTGIYKKAFITTNDIRHNETPGASYQDTDFWFQTLCLSKKVYLLDKPYYMNRRDNPNSSVYSNNKIYCFCDEYDYLYEKLFKEEQNKGFLAEFQLYRYKSYMSSLNKCAPEKKAEFIEKFKSDLQKSREKNELDLSLFTEGGKKTVKLILDETDKFIDQQMKKKAPEYKLSSNSTEILLASNLGKTIGISVIIPVYNGEKYIINCLDSVTSQTLKQIEIIVINDGSTDSTADLVKEYRRKDKRISLLNQPNLGSGAARNLGLKFAKGEYIAFMDADDWYPNKDVLNTLYSKAVSNKAEICGGSFSNSKKGKVTTQFTGRYKDYTFTKEGFIAFENYQFDYGYHRFIYSRQLIQEKKIKFPDFIRFQDPPFFIECLERAKKFYAIPDVVYCYRKGENTVVWNERKILDLLKGINFELRFSRERSYSKLHRIAVDHINIDFEKAVNGFLDFKYIKILEQLFLINSNIDKELLIKAGYEIDSAKDYTIKPLRRLKDKLSEKEKVLGIEIKTNRRKINVDCDESILTFNEQLIKVKNENEKIKSENEELKERLSKLKNGISYKIGRAITYFPRQIIRMKK